MNKQRIKVCWICSVSNDKIRQHLMLGLPWWNKLLRKILGLRIDETVPDYAVWNTNAIEEFKSIEEVELHVIFAHSKMLENLQVFQEDNINYYAVSSGDTSFGINIKMYLKLGKIKYEKTWNTISQLVQRINPDIIHLMGAENPYYSLSVLELSNTIPTIVQLQTLLHDPAASKHSKVINIQKESEYKVINHASYIGTNSKLYAKLIREIINPNAIFVGTGLVIGEKIDRKDYKKIYDFVYFANNVSKALDLVVDGFVTAYQKNPSLTLDIIGGMPDHLHKDLDNQLASLGIRDGAVIIEGKLQTHEDVLEQIKKAKFALLPLKFDLVSSTIREAMSAGLPVITTKTQGTPVLNENRKSVLLSEICDKEALAANMLRLVNDEKLAKELRDNAYITVEERYGNNTEKALVWVAAYRACIDNFHNGTPIPENLLTLN